MRLRQSLQGRGWRSIGLIVLSSGILCIHAVAQRPIDDVASIQRSFIAPPDDARPMMRWWWFGPGVVKPELEREILAMKAGGIGGFEIQPVYPMALDDQTKNFRNLPYLSDVGASCGAGFVNAGSSLDGYTIVEGHEYAETITDQNPAGGWTATSGQENADECAWISSGQGKSANVTMGNGSYPMQSTWSNDTNRCDISHPTVT